MISSPVGWRLSRLNHVLAARNDSRPALHWAILAVDVEGFGAWRTNPDLLAVREGLYRCLRKAFAQSGIPFHTCYHEDRGDGALFLIPPEVPKQFLVTGLPTALCAALRQHHEECGIRIRLRLALHAGEVHRDDYGVVGSAVNFVFRLLDAAPLKQALAGSRGALAVIVSPWFFEEVIQHIPDSAPASYRQVQVSVKETQTVAWVGRPDDPYPPLRGVRALTRRVPAPRQPPAPVADSVGRKRVVLASTWSGDRRKDAGRAKALPETADQLADAIRIQWELEVRVRRLNDPYPLPVSWVAADAYLADDWESLVRLATTGAGWPPTWETWASGPDGLAGTGGDLADVLERVPTGRLVVLGEPGAGKTMLMVRLVLDLLARRVAGGPVPVLVSLASWDPRLQSLYGWLRARLATDHPTLAAPRVRGRVASIQTLLEAGLILPILDGLDEVPDAIRGPAITRIRDALRPGQRVVVTCRTQQYRDIMMTPGGRPTLRAAAIELRPLDADTISRYLVDDAGDLDAAGRWKPVLAVLGTAKPAALALAKPLMLGLARAIYHPRPGEFAGELRDPGELCGPDLADPAAVQAHLCDAFIPAAYRSPDPTRELPRWPVARAERWLSFLAAHLEYTVKTPDLAWWQLSRSVSRLAGGLATGCGSFLLFGLAGWIAGGRYYGIWYGLAYGVAFGIAGGLSYGLGSRLPLTRAEFRLRGSPLAFLTRFAVGFMPCTFLALFIGAHAEILAGLALGLALAAHGWLTTPAVVKAIPSPPTTLAQDRSGTLGFAFAMTLALGGAGALQVAGPGNAGPNGYAGIAGATVFCAVAGAFFGRPGYGRIGAVTYGAAGAVVGLLATAWNPPVSGLGSGLAFGLTFGLGAGSATTVPRAWGSFVICRVFLALRGDLPWRLMSFLDDAHRRGVLRQAGAVYQFRHIELQQRLAARPARARRKRDETRGSLR